eukprot:MONOS_16465.1-p1 / transcript=MONOS_16465.1 / gene=MONOS_16465 / organism=Monocercomonoides_exilis_PA203 / gene_product=unspecified product / transcript_product=unspecified product / location=Mono_scaffold01766:264-5050(-) / protein_length=1317 / sequence_SO=supercontig / SO=protein_coding / is_pseudo=false
MNTKWLNMTKSNFTKIERTAGCGGCVNINNSNDENENSNGEINIEECGFDGCCVLSDGGKGGAIFAQMKGNTQLNIISSTFTGCAAPAGEAKTGFGGGMALKLVDGDSSFVISSPAFDDDNPNTAKYGNDLFVESPNLTKSITNASLPFVSENLNDISLDSMSGFDGNDTENAVPLIYFWRAIGSELFVGSEGRDMGACGFSDYPCLSIDYSLERMVEGNERIISVIGKAILQKSVDVSGLSTRSNNTVMCSLECLSSLEGTEGTAMKIQSITNFELISFVVPPSFASGVNVLLHIGSSEGLLTLKDCSFSKKEENEEEEEMINFGLIEADEGTVVLEIVAIQSLCFSQDIISVHPTTILNMKNLTMKNVELDGASGLSISKSSRREKNEVEQDVVIEWSSFEEVTQNTTDDIPIIRNKNDEEPLKMVVRNTTMKRCGGSKCEKGGGMFSVLNEGGNFDCSFCTISECFCSSTGRGGWLFLECTSTAEQPLNFVLSNITFRDNSAFRGRDVYVRCHSIETQIVDEQFLLDFRLPFVKELAMWGCTTDSFVGEEDLLLRVVKYQSETIFVSITADNHADSKQCGEVNAPCESLNVGVQHIIPSSYSQLLISKETVVVGECSVQDMSIRSLQSPSSAFAYLNSTITKEESLITTSENVRIERLKFNFGQLFSYSGSSIIHESSGQLSLSFVDFSSVGGSNINQPSVVLNSTLLSIAKGILHVDNCLILLLSFKKPFFQFCGEEISLTNMKLEQIESTRNVFEIGNCGSVALNGIVVNGVKLSEGCIISIDSSTSGAISVGSSLFKNCSRNSEGASVLSASLSSAQIVLSNCSCSDCNSLSNKGSMMEMNNAKNVSMHICGFEGILSKESESERKRNDAFEEICEWSGSLVHSTNTTLMMKDVTILNASSGGLSISSGNVAIEKGEEAEKKSDERIKKRVYAKSLGHSESSEHLLSESGSTEYILGRDSDKIPQWMLEKVDEKEDEETRKRTPSPSTSSTSTTDTSDTESTFVRGEDLCPTTSSMSNLVDAMACSSPHEKLIVDLRDSLFMLLHGRNEKKEMAIGTLKEREQTAAQVLFWVANLALHSFSEMDNPLQSLVNLSPHIVLFSEHMVICIVMHSDFSSDDDSDSSSISSSTVATSASNDDDEEEEDSLPSSAFEDEDDNFKKECLRWKAPELQMNKKMGATEKSVAFSIGMMLWECLTLQIPFGEYGAEAAGQKIVNGEVPNVGLVKDTPYLEFWRLCVSWNEADRPSLSGMKRELIGHFPAGAVMVTLTDAICDSLRDEDEEEEEEEGMEEEEDGMSEAISKEEGRKSRKYL